MTFGSPYAVVLDSLAVFAQTTTGAATIVQVSFTGSNGATASIVQTSVITTSPVEIGALVIPNSFYGSSSILVTALGTGAQILASNTILIPSVVISSLPTLAVPGQLLQILAASVNIDAFVGGVTVSDGAAFSVTFPACSTIGITPSVVASFSLPSTLTSSVLSVNALDANGVVYSQVPATIGVLQITLIQNLLLLFLHKA